VLLPTLEPLSPEKRTLVRRSSEDLGWSAGASLRDELAPNSSCRESAESGLLVPCTPLVSRFWSSRSREACPLDAPAAGEGGLEPVIACVCLNLYSYKAVRIKLSCFSCLTTSHQNRSNHNTVAVTRNNAFRASSQPPRFRCLVFSSSQVLERVDFARCDKHIRVCEGLGRTSCLLDKLRTKDRGMAAGAHHTLLSNNGLVSYKVTLTLPHLTLSSLHTLHTKGPGSLRHDALHKPSCGEVVKRLKHPMVFLFFHFDTDH